MCVLFLLLCRLTCALGLPNFIFVLTDDQDLLLNGLMPMKDTIKMVANKGAVFENAFVNTPICCPSRSTLLTGKYLHNTNVKNNSLSGNCSSVSWQELHEPFTVASLLNVRGYQTFYAGKYLNQYGSKKCGGTKHVPVGYNWWIGLEGNSKYYDYTLSLNGTAKTFTNEYLTDVINDYALQFLNQRFVKSSRFFMMLAPPASHAPFTPAPRHRNEFPNTTVVRTPAFNHTTSDKHWLINLSPNRLPEEVPILDRIQRGRMQSLLAVDEMIKNIVTKLDELKILQETYIIFTSDNGFHIGQFVQPWDKRQPYETDIRVPFFITGPNIKAKTVIKKTISSVDIMPTILDLAEIKIPDDIDGVSFKDCLINGRCSDGGIVLIEYVGEGNAKTIDHSCRWSGNGNLSWCTPENWCKCQDSRNNTYACIRQSNETGSFKFCAFEDDDHFEEAYNLIADPHELTNIRYNTTTEDFYYYKTLLSKLSVCKGISCRS